MEVTLDITKPATSWMRAVPDDLGVLIGHITSPLPNQKFNFKRFCNKPGQRYYQSPIDVGELNNDGKEKIGYCIFYKGYYIRVDNVSNEIRISK